MKRNRKFDIIYEDKELLVVNKPSHLLTIATAKNETDTLYRYVWDYIKRQNKNNKIFIVNRLDRETSGLVMFAKDLKLKNALQDKWNDLVLRREYIAIVEGYFKESSGTIVEYLKENSTYFVYATTDKSGKKAITEYETLTRSKEFSVLKLNLKTGRKNQIRVALSNAGHPIIGDKKYKAKKNPLRRLGLHAFLVELSHPFTGKIYEFVAPIPREFNHYIQKEL